LSEKYKNNNKKIPSQEKSALMTLFGWTLQPKKGWWRLLVLSKFDFRQ